MNLSALRRLLSTTIPHAGGDATLPILMAVYMEERHGVMSATATDRYRIAHCRYVLGENEIGLGVDSFALPLHAAKKILALFSQGTLDSDVSLSVSEANELKVLTVQQDVTAHRDGLRLSFAEVTGEYPKYRNLITARKDAEALPPEGIALNGDFLAAWRHAVPPHSHMPLRITPQGVDKVLLVRYGEDFIGGQMPVRLGPDNEASLSVWADRLAPESIAIPA